MPRRSIALRALVLATALVPFAGCHLLSGLAELEKDPNFDPDAAPDFALPKIETEPQTETASDTNVEDTFKPASEAAVETAAETPAKSCTELSGKVNGGHCYYIVLDKTWAEGKAACALEGAHLVTITSNAEQTFAMTVGSGDRWIGLSRDVAAPKTEKSSFKWENGETATTDHWATYDGAIPEPDGSGECARMFGDGRWADRPCESKFAAMCERDF